MIDQFYYKVYLPSIADYVRCKELKNHEYLHILKYNKNEDIDGLVDYLEQLIQDKVYEQDVDLHRIDKFCILLTMIMVCVYPSTTLQSTCEETDQQYDLSIDVGDILNIVSNISYSPMTTNTNGILIEYNYPKSLRSIESVDMLTFIDSITIEGKVFRLSNFDAGDMNRVLNALPGTVYKDISTTLGKMNSQYDDQDLLTIQSPYTENPLVTILTVDLVTNELFELVRILLGRDLNGYYELQYAMMTNYNFSPDYYINISPAESKIFYNYMKSDVEEKNNRAESAKQNSMTPAEKISG